MSIQVRDVKGEAEAILVHRAAVREFQKVFQCNPAAEPYPNFAYFLKAVFDPEIHVLAAWDGGRPMMFLIAYDSGEVFWLCACASWVECTPPRSHDGAYVKLTLAVAGRCGTVHGHVENETIRRRIAATSDLTVVDGSHMRWNGRGAPSQ